MLISPTPSSVFFDEDSQDSGYHEINTDSVKTAYFAKKPYLAGLSPLKYSTRYHNGQIFNQADPIDTEPATTLGIV